MAFWMHLLALKTIEPVSLRTTGSVSTANIKFREHLIKNMCLCASIFT